MKAKKKDWPTGVIYNRKKALDVRLWRHFGRYATFDGAEVHIEYGDSPAEPAPSLLPFELPPVDILFEYDDICLAMAGKWRVSQGLSCWATTSVYPMARIWINDEWGCSDSDLLRYWAEHETFSGVEVSIWPIHIYAPRGDEDDEAWEWHMYEKTMEWLDTDWDSDGSHDPYRSSLP